MLRRTALLALTGLLIGAAVAVPAAPARADEVYAVPAGGSFAVEGHGWGHGHGMSQWGAQGAATLGRTADAIVGFYYPGTTKTTLANTTLRVLISADTGGDTTVYSATGLTVTDQGSGATATLPPGPTRWRTTTDAAGLHLQSFNGTWAAYALGGKATFTGPIQFGGPAYLRLALPDGTSRDYRGAMRSVRTSATSVQSIDVLPMESYLPGVVPRESSSSWEPAALQAQAIAARTYAAENRSRYATSRAYDICDTTQCQVYGGGAVYTASGARTPLEAGSTNAAISATAGVIRTFEGAPIFAQFSSSNGGWTTDGGYPYLPAQRDDWDGAVANPVHSWTATLTAAQIQARFPAVGILQRIRVTGRDGNGEWGGRVKTVMLEGVSNGKATSVSTTGAGVYNAHSWPASSDGLRSSWWHVQPATSSAVSAQSKAPTLVKAPGNPTGTMTVVLRNSGTNPWSTSGLHLAVSSPPGAADALAGGSRTPGVYQGSASSVAPGDTAAFTVPLNASSAAVGTQHEAYRLQNGTGTLFGAVVTWDVPVVSAVLTAARSGPPLSTAPADGAPGPVFGDGKTVTVPFHGSTALTLTVTNTGNATWPANGAVRLGVTTPRTHSYDTTSPSRGASWTAPARPSAVSGAVAPGSSGTFALTLYGNDRPLGLTREAFEPVWDGASWLSGALTSLYVIRTDPSALRSATLEDAPTTVAIDNGPRATASVRVRLRNTGGSSWAVGVEALTASATPLSTSAWSSSTTPPALGLNASRPGEAKVYPGEVGEWQVPVSALKKAAGTYRLSVQAKGADGVYGPKVGVSVTVADAVLKGALVKVGPTATVPSGGVGSTYFDVRNTGNVAWPVYGLIRSRTLISGLSPSRAPSWLTATRPNGIGLDVTHPGASSVAPGEVARFTVALAGNGRSARSTSEPFGVVWDGWDYLPGVTATLAYRIS